MTTTLLPGLLRTLARNVSRGTSDLALFEAAPVTLPHSGAGSPILPVDRRPDRRGVGRARRRFPTSRSTSATPSAAIATAPAGGATDDRPAGTTSSRRPAWSPARSASSSACRRRASLRGTRDAVPSCSSARSRSGTPGSCTPRSAGRSASPAHRGRRADLDALLSRAGRRRRAGLLDLPGGQGGRRARRGPRTCRPASWPTPCARAPAPLCESVRLFDVYTGEQVEAGHKSLAFALRFRAPDRTLTEKETAPPATPRSSSRCSATEPGNGRERPRRAGRPHE